MKKLIIIIGVIALLVTGVIIVRFHLTHVMAEEGSKNTVNDNSSNNLDCVTYYNTSDIPYGIWESGWLDSPTCPPGYVVTGCGGGCNGIDMNSLLFDIHNDHCRVNFTCKGGGLSADVDATVRCCRMK